jgi:CrcB protein
VNDRLSSLGLIFLGGGVGSVLRNVVGQYVQGQLQSGFPFGTLVVNLAGCTLIGLLSRLFMHAQTDQLWRAALIVGFCGGFTTFSTFTNEVAGFAMGGLYGRAALYIGISVVSCVAGTIIALSLGPTLNR